MEADNLNIKIESNPPRKKIQIKNSPSKLTNAENKSPISVMEGGLPPKRARKASKKKLESLEVFLCANCPKTFTNLNQLKSHSRDHEDVEEKLNCDVCSESFLSVKSVMAHMKSHSCTCTVCDVFCSTPSRLKTHMKMHKKTSTSAGKGKPYVCKECGSAFSQSGHLSIHTRTHTGEKPYTCEICNTNFKQISHLKTHVRTHTQDKPYRCDQCPAAFTQNSSLKRHKRAHTGEKPYKCDLCGMTFVVKSNMQRHLNIHTGEKPFQCDLCSSVFGQAIDLKRHKISHTGIKPFKCDLCEAAFSRKNNLKWHKLTHSDIAGYECRICLVGFSSPSDLKAHMRNHAPPKPFSCDICPSSFRLLESLNRHKMIHTGERPLRNKISKAPVAKNTKSKPYICSICKVSFCEKRNLKRHTLSMHPEMNNTVTIKKDDSQDILQDVSIFPQVTEISASPQTSLVLNNGTAVVAPEHYIMQQQVQGTEELSQVPQILLAAPGQNPKPARPAGQCQNHSAHILTMVEGSFNHWQSWCFCDPQNIPGQMTQVIVPTATNELTNDGLTQILVAAGSVQQTLPTNSSQLLMTVASPANNQSAQHIYFNSMTTNSNDPLAISGHDVELQPNSAITNQYFPIKVEDQSLM